MLMFYIYYFILGGGGGEGGFTFAHLSQRSSMSYWFQFVSNLAFLIIYFTMSFIYLKKQGSHWAPTYEHFRIHHWIRQLVLIYDLPTGGNQETTKKGQWSWMHDRIIQKIENQCLVNIWKIFFDWFIFFNYQT